MTEADSAFQDALAHHKAGRLDEAAALYESAIAARADFTDAMINLGALRSAQEQFDSAAEWYAKVLERLPDDATALTNYANLRQRQGRHADAASAYRRVIELAPGTAPAHVGLGNALLSLGEFDDTIANYQTALALSPDDAAVYNNLGSAYMANGQSRDALACFERSLGLDPLNANAHNNFGTALCTLDNYQGALPHFEAAAKLSPDWAQAHFNLANALSRSGDGDNAIPSYRAGLALQPDNVTARRDLAAALIDDGALAEAAELIKGVQEQTPDDPQVHYMLGNLARFDGDFEDAVACHRRALELGGDIGDNGNNLANALLELGRTDEALELLLKTLLEVPDFPEGWNSLGNAYLGASQPDAAISAYQKALSLDPGLAMAASNIAAAHLKAGRLALALGQYRDLTAKHPANDDAWAGLGTTYQSLERFDEALAAMERALALNPDSIDALHNRGAVRHRLGLYGEALADYQRTVELAPRRYQSHFNLGSLLQVLSRHGEAIEAFNRALDIDPGYAAAYSYLAHSLMQECQWDNLAALVDKVIAVTEQEVALGSDISTSPFSLLQIAAPGPIRLAAARHVAAGAARVAAGAPGFQPFAYSASSNGKLRIGYLSPDFRGHSVGRAFEALLPVHDRAHFEVTGYFTAQGGDEVTERLRRNFDGFVELAGRPFLEAAQQINDDGIDILVDLAGHTRGSRFEILALKPAPVQAHFLGYGFTTGADYVDYLITDETTIPEAEQAFCTEHVVYLPHHSLPASKPVIAEASYARAEFGLPEQGFVFADFNGHYKIDADIFTAWMRILRKAPDSVLWLMGFGASDDNLRREAEARGVAPERLIFAERRPHDEHLARLSLADLALDTYHHAGGVTSTDALWAGLPVLTLLTDGMVDRTGASLMQAAGLPELIATSVDDYMQRALGYYHDRAALADLKSRLRAKQSTAPLFDMPRFSRYLEAAYQAMWQAHLDGQNKNIRIPA